MWFSNFSVLSKSLHWPKAAPKPFLPMLQCKRCHWWQVYSGCQATKPCLHASWPPQWPAKHGAHPPTCGGACSRGAQWQATLFWDAHGKLFLPLINKGCSRQLSLLQEVQAAHLCQVTTFDSNPSSWWARLPFPLNL